MRTFLPFLAAGLLLVNIAAAQDDPKSKAVLDKLVAKSKGYSSFEADFTSRLYSKSSKLDVKQDGTMKVKGKKFRLQLDKNTVINDGATMWTYNKEANEVSINDPKEMDQELDPSKLFTMYETGFKSQFVSEGPDAAGVVMQVLKLFPIDPAKKPYHTVVMTVDKAKVEPKSIQVQYKDGNEVTYTLKRFAPNVELADGLFTFDKAKFPGVEVNDLR
ncbi:MAG: outer membrane lipoprotein carrier protein LolA [Flavobacteriales bacterium]|nr:outer membrane lipoprotein carrier protein LolA [Flavobacteriales bacterium]